MTLDTGAAQSQIDQTFADSIVPTLIEYIGIPNKSPMFDPQWREHGHMDRAVELLAGWARQHLPPGATLEVVKVEDRTPVIFIEVPGTARDGDTVLLYGHLDKQPEMTGWDEGLGPWTPVLRGDKLYGRGGADDGYAIFASLTAMNVLVQQGQAVRALLRADRGVRGVGQLRSAGVHRAPRAAHRHAEPGGVPRLRLRQLRSAVVHHVAARPGDRHARGEPAARGRALRRRLRRRRVELPRRAPAARAPRGQPHRRDPAHRADAQIPRERIAQAARAAGVLGDEVWSKFPLQPGVAPVTRTGRADPEPHLAARRSRSRAPTACRPSAQRRQRHAAADRAQAVAAHAAERRRQGGDARG
jgi:hypothetical protein